MNFGLTGYYIFIKLLFIFIHPTGQNIYTKLSVVVVYVID